MQQLCLHKPDITLLLFQSVFLPQGYPDSVSGDYLQYQFWDTVQVQEREKKQKQPVELHNNNHHCQTKTLRLPLRPSPALCQGLWPLRPRSEESVWATRRPQWLQPQSPGY